MELNADDKGWRPFTAVERAMAQRMIRASSVPLATEYLEVDFRRALDKVATLRSSDVPMTVTVLILAAVAIALRLNPDLAIDVDYVQFRRRSPSEINIGVAVAGARGLVVPVVHSPIRLSLSDLARRLSEVVTAAREGARDLSLFRGGSFTITNLGSSGIVGGMPIPNIPQVAILGVGSAREVPVVREGRLDISLVSIFTVAIDHRAIDGATAARFLSDVKHLMENPDELDQLPLSD